MAAVAEANTSDAGPTELDTKVMDLAPRVAEWTVPYDAEAGPLSEDEVKQFYEDGYVVIKRRIIPDEVIEGAKHAVANTVDGLANELFEAGII